MRFGLWQVSASVNRPLMELLAKAIADHNPACVEMFREGGPLFGYLRASGNGVPTEVDMVGNMKTLLADRASKNKALIAGLREDVHSDVLLQKVLDDVALGRMTPPVPAEEVDLDRVILSPRFAVDQGYVCVFFLGGACKSPMFGFA